MPSAVMKPEKKACVEAEEPIKQALNVIEKKIRNLEKRRGKLEEYKAKAKGGAKLNDDQKQAISRYDSVLASLDFAKELTKQFTEIQEKAEKLMKKKLKFEQKVQHMEEVSRMQEVLRLQNLLDSMGSDEVREHFKKGTGGAITLSEDNLTQLDELYKLISPTRGGETSYAEQLVAAAEHLSCYVEDKDKEVVGTTYKDLRQMVNKIAECGYFDKTSSSDTEAESEQAEETVEENSEQEDIAQATTVVESEPVSSAVSSIQQVEQHQTPQQPVMHVMVNDVVQQAQPTQQAPITHQPQPASLSFTDQSMSSQVQPPPQSQSVAPEDSVQFGGVVPEEESFFSTIDLTKPRTFTDIVSSVQGNFDFLQDSEIDSQSKDPSAHIDPAVVAARPMHTQQAPQGTPQQPDAYSQPSPYTTAALQDQMAQLSTQEPATDVTPDTSAFRTAADLVPPQATQTAQFTPQSFDDTPQQTSWATAAEQSWGSSAAEHSSWVEQTSQPQSWAEQTSSTHPPTAWSTNTSQDLSSSGPAPIPMPNETVPGQPLTFNSADTANSFSQVASDSQENKSSLNPNANVFSMYSDQQGFQSHQADYDQRRGKDSYGQDGFQSQGYRGGRRDYGNNQQRSGGDRRSGGGRGGGYQGRGGRGGGYGGREGGRGGQGGGPYQNGGRGGGNRAGSTASQGGSAEGNARTYQGYPPRADYRPAGGYQGSSPFTGGMRGGPRGGSGGPRGGPRGGYGGRPNSGQ